MGGSRGEGWEKVCESVCVRASQVWLCARKTLDTFHLLHMCILVCFSVCSVSVWGQSTGTVVLMEPLVHCVSQQVASNVLFSLRKLLAFL